MSLHVLKPGFLSTVQDRGRFGHARFGVGHSGAMDRPALALANALVGNPPGAAALELSLVGPVLQFGCAATVALTGAELSAQLIDGQAVPCWRPVHLPAGSTLQLGRMAGGARSYLAVAGGLHAPAWLGSASVDLQGGIGRALRSGDAFELAAPAAPSWRVDTGHATWPSWSVAPRAWFDPRTRPLRIVPGAHAAALDRASRSALAQAVFRIAADSNRVGYRLEGKTLRLGAALEMVSEAVDFGTMQLPPGGDPIILMAEHPTTGGYPRIAQVAAVDLPWLAQQLPGAGLRFEFITMTAAGDLLARRDQALAAVIAEIARRRSAPDACAARGDR